MGGTTEQLGHDFKGTGGPRRSFELEPDHALDDHVVAQLIVSGREHAVNSHGDRDLLAWLDIVRQRRTAEVLPQNPAVVVTYFQSQRDLPAKAPAARFPRYGPRVRYADAVCKWLACPHGRSCPLWNNSSPESSDELMRGKKRVCRRIVALVQHEPGMLGGTAAEGFVPHLL